MRAALSLVFCAGSLGLGIYTVCQASKNRIRAAELDEQQRWCEAITRQNALERNEIAETEWRILSGEAEQDAAAEPDPRPQAEAESVPKPGVDS